ncbi:hypothetical protein BC830DRAFT_1098795 [Chytriomyces sp. MP71]|nr:hypothetical protein BC830DRAFT_1098795 [Chytriomyces sp. MP71]
MSESPKGPDEYQQMRNEGHDEYSAHAFNQLPIPIMDPHVQDLSQQDILHAHESHPHHHPTSQHQEHHFNMGMSMMTHYNPYPQHHQHHAYMNPLHMQGFHHAQQGRFQTGRDFVPFSSIPLTLIEGGFNSQGGCPDGSVGPTPGAPMDFQQHFMHFSPGIPHTMMGMGMVGVGMDGNPAFHFDKRPDSPNAWGWVTNEGQIPGAPGGEAGESMSQPGMMDGGPMGHTDIVGDGHLEVDPITGQPLLPIPQPQTYMMDNGARQGFLGGMSGAGVPNEDGEGMPSGTSSSSNQDGEEYDGNKTSRTDKNMRRGKGAVYCMHRKLLNRCPDCSSLGNPSHVITRVSAVCHHGKRRSQCIQCYDEGTGGSIICEHRRQKYACPKVCNSSFSIAQ